ncbi:hypothetical protein WDU94_014045 [Cyamophila willieti]
MSCVFGSKDIAKLQSAERTLEKMFDKMKKVQRDKMFINYKLDNVMSGANELDDELAMLKIELSNYPDIPHQHIFKLTKNIAREWGIFNEDEIADMYVFSKDACRRQDKNVIIAFKTMSAKYRWLDNYKKTALKTGLISLRGFKGIPVSFHEKGGQYIKFHVKMLDHVSRYKAFLLSVCLGKARTINKFDNYRFWVNQSQIYGVCQNAGGVTGKQLKHFRIDCFDDISSEIT